MVGDAKPKPVLAVMLVGGPEPKRNGTGVLAPEVVVGGLLS